MKKKTIIAIASLLIFGQGAWALTGSWGDHKAESFSTTSTNSITIKSEAELALLAYNVNNGTNYEDYTITLDKDLNLSAHYWVPIGMEDGKEQSQTIQYKAFKGTFDGNGKTISGITVNMPEGWGVGLFGYISKATIKNLTITSSSFTANGFVGAIVGSSAGVSQGTPPIIEKCHVTELVTVTATDYAAGGIIGIDNDNLTIKDCTCAATISSSDTGIGGIIGVAFEDDYMVTITDSYYLGNMPAIGENGGHNDNIEKYATINITLLNNDTEATVKNSTRIANYHGQTANVTLDSHTLFKDGKWNTLCLPFSLTSFTGTPLADATVKALSSTAFDNETGTLTLNFTEGNLTTIAAGTPYIVKWTGTDENKPEFNGVTINNTQNTTTPTTHVDFVGSFSSTSLAANDKTVLYLGADNKLYYPSANRTVGSCRAYFKLNGLSVGTPSTPNAGVRAFSLNFGDGETTGISDAMRLNNKEKMINNNEAEANSSLFTLHSSLSGWYDLQGRRISVPSDSSASSVLPKGVYIHNGRKVVIP